VNECKPLILGLFMKKYKLTYYLHEAGATLLLGVVVGLIIWSGNTSGKARGLLKTGNAGKLIIDEKPKPGIP
jgi:hypothetical protein